MTSFALELVHGLDLSFGRTRVGVVTFSTESRNEFFLASYQDRQSILNRMRFEHYGGRTNIYSALQRVADEQLTINNGYRIRANHNRPQQVILLRDLCDTMIHGSLCAMGGMTPFPVLSALNHFPQDFGLDAPDRAAA